MGTTPRAQDRGRRCCSTASGAASAAGPTKSTGRWSGSACWVFRRSPESTRARGEGRMSYRIDESADQARQEQARLRVLADLRDPSTRRRLTAVGIAPGWRCCDVGSGAGTIAAWMAEQVGSEGSVVSVDVDTRFQPPSSNNIEVRTLDITSEPIGDAEFDLVHARAVLEHVAEREAVLDNMIAAAKPGGWIVATDADWVQFDAQPVPEPFATLSSSLRALSSQQHGF